MTKGVNIKTQTRRSTKWHDNIINVNLFCKDLEFGIITSKYWGDYESRDEPLITLSLKGKDYEISMNDFIARLEIVLSKPTH